jgi:hypothetical protein
MSSVVLLGSGALARSVCYSLAVSGTPMIVTVAARDGVKAAEIAYVGNVRAALSGSPVRCRAVPSQLADPLELSRVLAATMPNIVLLAASFHSPCERLTNPSAWTSLLDRTGFGVTAPLHALLAITTAQVVAQTGRARLLIASFPDAVNPILAALGLPVFAGVGNAALLTASLRAALDVHPRTRVRMLAHHVHLDPPDSPANEARAWIDDTQVPDVTSALAARRSTPRCPARWVCPAATRCGSSRTSSSTYPMRSPLRPLSSGTGPLAAVTASTSRAATFASPSEPPARWNHICPTSPTAFPSRSSAPSPVNCWICAQNFEPHQSDEQGRRDDGIHERCRCR